MTTSRAREKASAFVSTLDNTHREMSDNGGPRAGEAPDNYLLKVDNPLVVPVNKKIRIITTANDVIHAFAVPAFGIKQDAIPGFVRDTWFRAEQVGDFYGQCQELCGKEHAYMPIHVKVVSAADYTRLGRRQGQGSRRQADDPTKVWTLPGPEGRGEKVYAANCAACHQANGKGAGPIKPLDGSPIVLDADHKDPYRAAQRRRRRRHAFLEATERHRHRRRDQLLQEQLVQPDRPDRPARRSAGRPQVSRSAPRPEFAGA
jgi:mono/diheme cytochrome c family protein